MNPKFVLDVLAALVDHFATRGESPSVRDLCTTVGWPGEKEVWWALQVLEEIGAIRWPIDNNTGRRTDKGIELLIELKQPVRVPIVGYLNAPADFIPGTQWIEFHQDGRITVVEGDRQWEGIVTYERTGQATG